MVKRSKNESLTNMPEHLDPMLCTLVRSPLESEEYIYELKWDGYRIISRVENGTVRMNSRSGLDYTSKYPLVAEALQNLGHEMMIDGEVVVMNEDGRPDFDALQLYNGKRTPIRYCVFDLLYLDGNNLMALPLYQRKELLKTLTKNNEVFLFSESFDDSKTLYEKVLKDNLEGIVAKKKDSHYIPGARSYDWLKVPTRKRQEFVIGGWAESDKSRSFKSLLFGTYDDGKFTWIGRSGGGYKQNEMPAILKKLQQIETAQSPFVNKILDIKGAKMHYVEPKLVANFEFATWTKSGRIRKPATFLGFRDDKNPLDVVREMPVAIEKIEQVIENQQNQDEQTIESNNPALVKYNDKRQFDQTPEPTGGKAGTAQLIFVVQKHNASHLHYDFRLEIRGVLKSWAVPKGPSMNPADHRLAMAVEDHPYDYKDFEGIIPEGQYGGGTVLVWDCGTYEPEEKIETKTEQEHWLLANYYKNKLNIILHGKKLKGKFNLVRTYGRAENAWLLTKVKDGYELEEDITQKDQSVLSGLTLLEVAMNNHSKLWQSNREPLFDHSDETTTSVPLTNRDVNDRGSFITFKKQLFTDEKAGLNNTINDLQLDAKELNDQEEKMPAESQIKHKIVGELFQRNKRSSRFRLSPESNWNRVFEEKIVSEGTIEIEGKKLLLTNIEKNLWKGTNKAQLITYYNSVAEFILPHLKGRPLSLHIKNLNAQAPGLYIKDMEGFQPDFLDIYPTRRKHIVKGKADIIDYAVCNNLPSLLWLINLGCIDINPWNSTTINPGEPDFIAINFEPSDDDFRKAVQAALYAKEYFDEWKLTTFIKTSGTAGIHVFIPCSGINYPQSKIIAEHICTEIYRKAPQLTTMEIVIEKRADKLFIDYYRNDQADTLASAYSVRAGKMPTVSTPISWDELSLKLKPTDFTIENIQSRLLEKGDLWKQLNDPNIKTKNSRILKQAKGFIMQTVTGNKVIRNSK